MVSSGEKYYKYFIGHKDDDDCKIKAFRIVHSKTSTYVKSYDGETKWMIFLLKMLNCWKSILISGGLEVPQ